MPLLVTLLPQAWQNDVNPAVSHLFSAWTGFGVLAMYAAIALIGGMVAFRGRDA